MSGAPLQPVRDLVYGGILGEGGMGVVYEAQEPLLGRSIAAKRLRTDRTRSDDLRALLREARITSAVSHPNVVPVHDVRIGEDGQPVILLKRIEGRPWSRLLRDPDAVRSTLGQADPLAFHVEVLIRVCAAMHAAHTRQIVHRDLKPGNIMVGPDGEVYVLDWGLAASLDPQADPRLPRLEHSAPGAGTPQYMAPEMVSERYGQIGPWTDVYLIGGLLFQVLWDRPPHGGANAVNMVIEACRNGVTVPDDGPAELVELCRACLTRRPQDRIQDAETVRRALLTWLDHRASVALADEATAQEARLLEHMQSAPPGPTAPEVHDRFGAAVFGYHRALEAWSDNPAAKEGLERTVRAVVEHTLARGEVSLARAAISYLSDVPDDLQGRIDLAEDAAARSRAQLARWTTLGLGDVNVASRAGITRVWLLASGFALVAATSLTALAVPLVGSLHPRHLLYAALLGLAAVLLAVGRGLGAGLSGLNLRIAGHLFSYAVVRVLVLAAAVTWGVSLPAAVALDLGVTSLLLVLQSLAFDHRLRSVALVPASAAILGLVLPAAAPALLALALVTLGVENTLSDLVTRRELRS